MEAEGLRRALRGNGRWAATGALVVAGALIQTTFTGCSGKPPAHSYSPDQLGQLAATHGLRTIEADRVELLLDSSASMRGFALAAIEGGSAPADAWWSVFYGLDVLDHAITRSGAAAERKPAATALKAQSASGPGGVAPPAPKVIRFSAGAQPVSASVSLLDLVQGRVLSEPIDGLEMGARRRSRPCDKSTWVDTPVRRAVDNLFSGSETCLGTVFDHILSERSGRSLHVIVTDAEQSVGEGSTGCPMGVNPAPIQARLHEWVHTEGRFAAVVVLSLPYRAWQMAAGSSRAYCECEKRNLFVYLLGPSADAVEAAYLTLAEQWKGDPQEMIYLPLAPRPAGQYNVEARILGRDGKTRADLKLAHLTNPGERGSLPVFSVRMDAAKTTTVSFSVSGAVFETASAAKRLGAGRSGLPADAHFWADPPLELAPASAPGKRPASVGTVSGARPVFTRLADPKAQARVKYHWDGSYLARVERQSVDGKGKELISGTWEIKPPRGGGHGCALYLFEARAKGNVHADRLIASTPILRGLDSACTGASSLASQIRHVSQETAVARFLLHVDW